MSSILRLLLTAALLVPCGAISIIRASQAAGSAPDPTPQLRERLQQNPEWQEGWWLLGSSLYDSDRYSEAADALAHLVRLRPTAAPAWALLGLSEFETQRYRQALEHVDKALALGINDQPQMDAVLRFHQALLLNRAGQFDKALQRYSQFVPQQISDRQLLLGLGLLALRRPGLPSEVAPSEAPLISDAGAAMARLLTGSADAARSDFERLVAVYPAEPGVHFALGFALFAVDQDASIAALRQELVKHPENSQAPALLAWMFFVRGEPAQALEQARTALAKDPELSILNILLARDEIERGDPASALKRLNTVAQREPENLEAHLALASAYSAAGQKLEAQRERQVAVRLRTTAVAQP